MLNCLIVDDEPLAQDVIAKHVAKTKELYLAGIAYNAVDAFAILHKVKIDLIFLDIRMPMISGMEFLKSLSDPPMVIFTTAYSEFAVHSYEVNAIDYLLKPITYERFSKSVKKVLRTDHHEPESHKDYMIIRMPGNLTKIYFSEIIYIESLKDYVKFHTTHGEYITLLTMKSMEAILPGYFLRIHRSFIISTKYLISVGTTTVKLKNINLPIGIRFKKSVKALKF